MHRVFCLQVWLGSELGQIRHLLSATLVRFWCFGYGGVGLDSRMGSVLWGVAVGFGLCARSPWSKEGLRTGS